MNYIDWIGSVGVFLILLAYLLNLRGLVKTSTSSYVLLNFAGATLACFASVLLEYYPFVILEAIWALVSLYSLVQVLKIRHAKKEPRSGS